jgi:flagellin-specific chaperone FliS
MQYRLIEANIKRSAGHIDEVLQMLRELRQAWAEAVREYRGQSAGSARPGGNMNGGR